MSKILVIDDTAFMGSQKARNMSTIKTKNIPSVREADLVIYLGRDGHRIIKGVGHTLKMLINDIG